jgi:hypothetical protein
MNLVFAALIDDGPMPERGADHLGNDPVEAYWASSASLHATRVVAVGIWQMEP